MIEILDVYNREKNRIGKTIERKLGEKLNKGEYIISVQCWIINRKGEILLTQRRLNKKTVECGNQLQDLL
jgi:isopentenyldiphosphate isomerase